MHIYFERLIGGNLAKDLPWCDIGWFALNMVKISQLSAVANGKAISDLFCVCVKIIWDPKCKHIPQKEHR